MIVLPAILHLRAYALWGCSTSLMCITILYALVFEFIPTALSPAFTHCAKLGLAAAVYLCWEFKKKAEGDYSDFKKRVYV